MKPKLLMSDLHLHSWSAFSETQSNGVNSRLEIILCELEIACHDLMSREGDTCYIAGDLFHVRGSIAPSVLNPVRDKIGELIGAGMRFRIIPGNHDLETRHTTRLTNASQALEDEGCEICHEPTYFEDDHVFMVPWIDDLGELKRVLKEFSDTHPVSGIDAIIHAPMNGVLVNIPDSGLNPAEVAEYGFRRVFCGHYHNGKNLDHGCYSIGSLTHQTWSDVGTNSGYWVFNDKAVVHTESGAPQFKDFNHEIPEDQCEEEYAGHYVRVKLDEASEKEVRQIREAIIKEYKAAGCIVQASPKTKDAVRTSSVEAGASVLKSIDSWIKTNVIEGVDPAQLLSECDDILSESDKGAEDAVC